VAAAVEGRGVTRLLSYQVADELADGRLTRLLGDFEPAPIPVQLVTPSGRMAPPRVRAFVEFAAGELARLPILSARAREGAG
jgi:DNA-binding transcriptional LysR family regulator